jgi:hypothetical protein
MSTVGWIFILVGIVIMRQAIKGRPIQDIPGDIGDILRGAATSLQSPSAGADIIKEVMSRHGASLTYGAATDSAGNIAGNTPTSIAVLSTMKSLAAAANYKYVWGASGPNGYDCSGLVWAAMKKTGYTGLRFTTYTFVMQLGSKVTKSTTPSAGDIVLWPSHMGCMESATTMFSALNPNEGIKSSPLSYGPKNEGNPTFWRLYAGAVTRDVQNA